MNGGMYRLLTTLLAKVVLDEVRLHSFGGTHLQLPVDSLKVLGPLDSASGHAELWLFLQEPAQQCTSITVQVFTWTEVKLFM